MNNYKINLKLLLIMLFNNACLRKDICYNDCPLKCGFESQSYRCFFDCGEDDVALDFSNGVFYDRGKTPPVHLIKLRHSSCNEDTYECYSCSWHNEDGCKLFKALANRCK